jgi:hypothetical protein
MYRLIDTDNLHGQLTRLRCQREDAASRARLARSPEDAETWIAKTHYYDGMIAVVKEQLKRSERQELPPTQFTRGKWTWHEVESCPLPGFAYEIGGDFVLALAMNPADAALLAHARQLYSLVEAMQTACAAQADPRHPLRGQVDWRTMADTAAELLQACHAGDD